MGIEFLTFVNPAAPPPTNQLLAIFFYILLTPIAVTLQFLDHVFRGFGPTQTIGAFGFFASSVMGGDALTAGGSRTW